MKRREVVLAALGVLALAAGCFLVRRAAAPSHNFVLDDGGCRTPVTLLEAPDHLTHTPAQAVVLHGLSANRRIMQPVGARLAAANMTVYLLDLPGHGDSTDAYSFARAEQCATVALASLARRGQIQADTTVLVGHSMGGAVAVRMADRFPVAATIAISPAPMVLPRRMPANLLVLSAQFDMERLKDAALALEQAAGGDRRESTDFAQRRAFWLEHVRHATHTSLLNDPAVNARMVAWAHDVLPRSILHVEPVRGLLFGGVAGVLGLLLLFPLAATGSARMWNASGPEVETERAAPATALLHWSVAALFSVGVLNYVVPLRYVRMLTGDYLASLLLLTGILLLAFRWKAAKAGLRFESRQLLMGFTLGLAVMLGIGAWLNWQLSDAWLNAPRWWRFALLLLACWPYCYAEEITLGPPGERRAARFGLYLLLRFLLWLACIVALFAFGSGQILIFLLVAYMAVWSILQRLGTDGIRRRTGSATAAATFDAILAAWFIAAVFPLS